MGVVERVDRPALFPPFFSLSPPLLLVGVLSRQIWTMPAGLALAVRRLVRQLRHYLGLFLTYSSALYAIPRALWMYKLYFHLVVAYSSLYAIYTTAYLAHE